jgi:hypothetical protein
LIHQSCLQVDPCCNIKQAQAYSALRGPRRSTGESQICPHHIMPQIIQKYITRCCYDNYSLTITLRTVTVPYLYTLYVQSDGSYNIYIYIYIYIPPLWSSGQNSWQLTQTSRVRLPAFPDFLSSSGSGSGVHSALVRINEGLLERKVAAPV